ncbi:hypothetical protein DPMN_044146 [Dreissena polymorpha]|uniref:Uncharacterized protein n=1 Tax=Dreissena polymorpha TaxID=45954 RepID=A0A9D4D5A9_DREPO|nr:hypothetical protein DPMN_044146 [Dreissena polymorpha]
MSRQRPIKQCLHLHAEYLVYAHNPGGFDFKSSGAVNAENTCGDSVFTVRETLIVNIISTVRQGPLFHRSRETEVCMLKPFKVCHMLGLSSK